MSEVENPTTDIDNNIQETPTQTPRKRISRAEKARIESEELLKSLGVSLEAGRQTRSSRRGTAVESPKPEPVKRRQTATPRGSKKPKVTDVDQTDSTNHVNESVKSEAEAAELPTTNSNVPKKVDSNAKEAIAETQIVPNIVKNEEKMEIDISADSKESENETKQQAQNVPQPKESQPAVDQAQASLPIEVKKTPPAKSEAEASLPATSEVSAENVPTIAAKEPEVLENDGLSIAADTTTTPIVIDTEPIVSEPSSTQSSNIELVSSPIEIDAKEIESVNNSQATEVEPDAIVELESSSNEGDPKIEAAKTSQERDSLDLEIIDSDSSHSVNEVQIVQSSIAEPVEEQSLPTSTQVTITKIIDTAADNSNDILEIKSSETSQNSVESTNNLKSAEIPEKFHSIAVASPIDETITPTSTSETLMEPNATTA